MPRLSRRLIGPLALTAAAGLGIYVWKRWGYAVAERERDVATLTDGPVDDPPQPAGRAAVQPESDGVGPRFHRRYRVDVASSSLSPRELIERIGCEIQAFVPDEIARFEKTVGREGQLAVGDEYHIHISSPWDGPVRVAEVDETSFVLATLEGHLEAGQIRFEAADHPTEAGALRFTIESWARSKDAVVDLAYDGVGIAKKAQQAMWTFFCNEVVAACDGETLGEIDVLTEREADGE